MVRPSLSAIAASDPRPLASATQAQSQAQGTQDMTIARLIADPSQIRFYVQSALNGFEDLDQDDAIENCRADLESLLSYLAQLDDPNINVVQRLGDGPSAAWAVTEQVRAQSPIERIVAYDWQNKCWSTIKVAKERPKKGKRKGKRG
jgi:hypothetical protein